MFDIRGHVLGSQIVGTVKKVYVNLTKVTYFQNFESIFYLGIKIEKNSNPKVWIRSELER